MRADAAENRAALIRAAWRLISDQGPNVSMRAIAAEAGVGVGTLYRNFPEREDLLVALIADGGQRFMDIIERHSAGWDTQDEAEATWASFTREVKDMKLGRIGLQVMPEVDHFHAFKDRYQTNSEFLQEQLNRVLDQAKRWNLVRDEITPMEFHLGLSSVTRPWPAIALESCPEIEDMLFETYVRGLRP